MAHIDWEMQGWELANCNCNWGCPCQFNQLPTHGHCCAYAFVQIDKGRFGKTSLDGLRWGILAAWPGAVHHGNGTFMTIIDERARPEQRAAIEAVSHGKETDPGSLIWQVFSTTVTKFLPTIYKSIDVTLDVQKATGSVKVPGLLEGTIEPMRNPVTNQPHRARLVLPNGFEFTEAEFASGSAKSSGEIKLDFTQTFAQMGRIHWSTHGVVR